MGVCLNFTQASQVIHRVNSLALGTVQFGLNYGIANRTGQVSRAEAKAMLQLALANSIDTLDTAILTATAKCVWAKWARKASTWLPNCPKYRTIAQMSAIGFSSM